MRCASCGEKIEGTPIWREDEAYCSEDCADLETIEDEYEDEEEEHEGDYEEEEDEEV
jgi:hypothetical protein